jgi:SAM-dependent methyltransferase
MKREWLPLLRCPVTGGALTLEATREQNGFVREGLLRTATTSYFIVNGIPRFVPAENYSSSFGRQWHVWKRVQFENENIGGPMEGHTTAMFETITGHAPLAGETVLDLGCGPGRFLDVCLTGGAKLVIGVDYSNAVDVAADNLRGERDRVFLIQGDALALPIVTGAVDVAYSIGVLHHTPSSAKGFAELTRIARSGGTVAVAVYGKGYYSFPPVTAWRKFFNLFDEDTKFRLAMGYARFTTKVLEPLFGWSWATRNGIKLLFPFVSLPDRRWAVLDTFDSVTPAYQNWHTPQEVRSWYEANGFATITPTDWGPSHVGVKK